MFSSKRNPERTVDIMGNKKIGDESNPKSSFFIPYRTKKIHEANNSRLNNANMSRN